MMSDQWDYPGANAMEAAKPASSGLACAACGKAVTRAGDQLVRACTCTGPVIASLSARMAGSGGLRKS